MPHIIVFCFPAMKFESRPGLRAHPLSARRSRRSHESLGHNRSPRGRFGKMNVSGMTHLNALHHHVAFLKHEMADSVSSGQFGQPFQSVTLIGSKRGVERQIPIAFLAERDSMVASGFNPRKRGNQQRSRRGATHAERERSTPGIVMPRPHGETLRRGRLPVPESETAPDVSCVRRC